MPLLQVVKKRNNQRGIDLFEAQSRRCPMQPLSTVLQELPERVAIGTDGVRACLTLLHQTLCKEALQQ
jgi:hypothetical protein